MAFLGGVRRCCKLDCIRNEAIRDELQVFFNYNEKLKYYKQRLKEHLERQIPDWPNKVWKYRTQVCG